MNGVSRNLETNRLINRIFTFRAFGSYIPTKREVNLCLVSTLFSARMPVSDTSSLSQQNSLKMAQACGNEPHGDPVETDDLTDRDNHSFPKKYRGGRLVRHHH